MGEGSDINELERLRPSQDAVNRLAEKPKSPEDNQKWRLFLEPALVGAMIAINLGQTSLQNLYLSTACTVDLGKNMSICDRGVGEEFRAAEAESQIVVSSINVSRSFIGSLISTVVLLFVGPWSDCSGRRKPLLIMPLVGMSVMTTGVLLMLIFPGASTAQVLYMVQIPISLGGNFGLLLAAAFSHIGDVCHATGRDVTRTMGTHRAAIQVAHVVGAISGPLLYRHLGFYGVFPLVLLLQLSSLAYVIFSVKDVNVNKQNTVSAIHWRLPINAVKCLVRRRDGHKRTIILLMLVVALADRMFLSAYVIFSVNVNTVSAIHWRLPINAVKCLVRRRDGHKRTIILLMLVVALADRMFLSAEVLLAYMYYRYKFHWDDVLFGSFLAYRNIISFLGTLLILMVLKRRFKLSDEVVGALSCFSYVLTQSGLIVASTTICVFFIPLIGIISQGSQVVQRPLLNKQILPTEQGKIYSVLGALESATQTISAPLYSLLYSKTVSKFPDAWLIPGIFLAILQILAYLRTKQLGNKDQLIPQIPVKKNIPMKTMHKTETEKPMLKNPSDTKNQRDLKGAKT